MFTFSLNVTTKAGRELITSFSLSVNTYDKIALIGEEGNGKSLFLKALTNNIDETNLNVSKNLSNTTLLFGYMKQELSTTALQQTLYDFALDYQWEKYHKFLSLMHQLLPHLTESDYHRKLSSFSGGECVRIQLLKVALMRADVYIFDEPTNNLDLETIVWFESWLLSLTEPVLFVSHDTHLIRNTANRILHFEQLSRKSKSRITLFEGSYDDFHTTRSRMISHHNNVADNQMREREKQQQRWQQQYNKVSHQLRHVARNDPGLQKKMKNLKAQKRRFERCSDLSHIETESPVIINPQGIQTITTRHLFKFDLPELLIESKRLATALTLSMTTTDRIACIGNNGSGKTTFIHYLNTFTKTLPFRTAILHQDIHQCINLNESPLDNCVIDGSKEERESIAAALGGLRFTSEEMTTPLNQLSGGQRTKTALLKILRQDPDLLILDEPTRNLSPDSVAEVVRVLKAFPKAIFCVTHDRAFISELFPTCITLTPMGFKLM
ncbi:ABC-F family ATP-binding cassette domain-containing protein [Erysipelothrix sp. HDW6C]|uniref:ATP-binding cassette domain-containing protein n=1 Tax=Erysipelothrix sp. HDW6C TaxID=2714930 RepID=UPI001409C5F2|nr:ATP-binding cassette domain-containing protein [Erysipelothrix sp. HDW6C]QIK69015.1 ABC-F family ATP-binding cassette domain-containing protein [Erysipelothrix sp. HDW6C]